MGAKITQYSLKMLTLRRKIKSFMKIGIITAMSSEQKQLANQLDNKTEHREGPFSYIEGTVKNNTHILMQCGIGKVNAAAGTVELIRNFQPDCIISTGVAGGIDSEGDDTLYNCALSLDTETPIHGGLICTGDKFITDRTELNAIKQNFPEGLAVDMESAAIAQVCHLYRVPFISFRIISDTPGADKHLEQYKNFWGEIADNSFRVTETFLKALPNKL